MGYQIAIDGPAGAGKSTIARRVAKEAGYVYVDTGAMYRGLAIHFLNEGIAESDIDGMIRACEHAEVTIQYENGCQQIYLNGQNVTSRLREEEVGHLASIGASVPAVRQKLLALQRNLASEQDVVMDGRDIGTCVLPNADVKIYLTASVQTRAKRRFDELKEKGIACDLNDIEQDIRERDRRDSTRAVSPLRQAEDAVLVDSSDMDIEKVTKVILDFTR